MLLVDAIARPSRIHGMGLFARERIPKGTVVWRYLAPFDIKFNLNELAGLAPTSRNQVLYYASLDYETGLYLLSADDERFVNHSTNPNVGDAGDETIAIADIAPGEELTMDYRIIGTQFGVK